MSRNDPIIRTSVSVQLKWKLFLEEYAENHCISVSELINTLLEKQLLRMKEYPESSYSAMKYQPRGLGYKPVHLNLRFVKYSRLKDVMCVFRFTLSYILSLAMESFDEFMDSDKNLDCYPHFCHSTIITEVENITVFANYWGIPPGEHTITVPPG
ncbi:MAG: hypothetical protein PF637_11565 [Spirochaetes bacterium]|jgi:hypothetical protein|nr:hypothetical protein [Spirochaetota bacterium]